jgi:hypothetical protein
MFVFSFNTANGRFVPALRWLGGSALRCARSREQLPLAGQPPAGRTRLRRAAQTTMCMVICSDLLMHSHAWSRTVLETAALPTGLWTCLRACCFVAHGFGLPPTAAAPAHICTGRVSTQEDLRPLQTIPCSTCSRAPRIADLRRRAASASVVTEAASCAPRLRRHHHRRRWPRCWGVHKACQGPTGGRLLHFIQPINHELQWYAA